MRKYQSVDLPDPLWPVRTNATGFAEFNKKPDSKWLSVGGRLNFDLDVTLIF
jgi:hypothetical protein